MRRVFAVLALATLVVACSDQPAAPTTDGPQLAQIGAEHGALVTVWTAEMGFCFIWDAEGNYDHGASPCKIVYTPSSQGTFVWRIFGKVPNNTGKAVHFGPSDYPPGLADYLKQYFDLDPVNGLLPLCDWNPRTDPGLEDAICTTNWSYTISPTGNANFQYHFDPGHSWRSGLALCTDVDPTNWACHCDEHPDYQYCQLLK